MTRRIADGVWSVWPLLAVGLVLMLATAYGAFGSEVSERTIVDMFINAVLVFGLYVFVGNSGVFSFGHIAFMAIGAYVTGLLSMPGEDKELFISDAPSWLISAHLDAFPALMAGALGAALVAAVLAIPLMRIAGIAAALAMFAVLITVNVVASNLTAVTGGTSGLTGVPATLTLGGAAALTFTAAAIAFAFQRHTVGLKLRASREDEVVAKSLGIGVFNERRVAFVISGFLTGLAGGMYAQWNFAFTPDAFFLSITFLIIAMLVVGGTNSLSGALVGVLLLTAVSEILRNVEEGTELLFLSIPERPGLREVGMALILLAVLIYRPKGIKGSDEFRSPPEAVRDWTNAWRDRRVAAAAQQQNGGNS